MATPPDPQQPLSEHPSTYVVQDRSNDEERLRVEEQDRFVTRCMGGVLSEQPDPPAFQRILDVGCGPGGWLIETAKTYPEISLLAGIDVSGRMIEVARENAKEAGVSDRVQFKPGDALRMIEFSTNFFDLVNQRFAMSWLRKWDWPKILREYQRVCKRGGIIRITEASLSETNSPALNQLFDLLLQAFWQAGHFFAKNRNGVIDHLVDTMQKYGIEQVQTHTHNIVYHADPQMLQAYTEDVRRLFRTLHPFLRKWTRLPVNYEEIYQQMVRETQPDIFEATATVLTVRGINVEKRSRNELYG